MDHPGRGIVGLKEDLCRLRIFKTADRREALLSALRGVGIEIDPDINGAVRESVSLFVDICLEHPHALERLKTQIAYFEGPTRSAAKAIRAIEELLPSPWFESVAERDEYLTDLETQLGPDGLKRLLLAEGLQAAPVSADALVRALETRPPSGSSHPLIAVTAQAARTPGPGAAALDEWTRTLTERLDPARLAPARMDPARADLPQSSRPAEPPRPATTASPGGPRDRDVLDDAGGPHHPFVLESLRRRRATQGPRYRGVLGGRGGPRVLAIGTEWASAHGGLSTFNRQLCIVLSAAGADVTCLAGDPTDAEVRDAADSGVRLVGAPPADPEVIIGHGWITGERARDLAARSPGARRVHFFHMAAEENEWQKTGRPDDAGDRAAARRSLEIALGASADLAVAVGPRLFERFSTDLAPHRSSRLLRFDPGFDFHEPAERPVPPGSPWRILVFGRTDDELLKGLDLAAKAVARADRHRGAAAERIELVVRGAAPGTAERLRDRLRAFAGVPGLRITVRPYTPAAADIAADLAEASLVLLPSRTEGFGLSGLEAITAGTPLLVSGESGLGMLLAADLPAEQAQRMVVPISHDDDTDAEAWDRAVWAMLRDREASFARAAEVHRAMAAGRTWHDAADLLLGHLARRR